MAAIAPAYALLQRPRRRRAPAAGAAASNLTGVWQLIGSVIGAAPRRPARRAARDLI